MNDASQNSPPPNLYFCSWPNASCWRRLLASGITLVLAVLCQSVHAQGPIGQWLTGAAAFNDVSTNGAIRHDAVLISGGADYVFTNDVPTGFTGQSIFFTVADTGLAITNSSDLDSAYDTTFDDGLVSRFSVMCWAKGFPANWDPFVSKYGESSPESGWQLRDDGSTGATNACFTVRNGSVGTILLGTAVYGNSDDLATRSIETGADGKWHHYAGVFDATTRLRTLYVDGSVAAQETNNVADIAAPDEHVCINAKDSPPGAAFGNETVEQLFDVRIYNRVVTQDEIQRIVGVTAPAVTAQPLPSYSYPGSNAQVSVKSLSGTRPFTYQWIYNSAPLANNAHYAGANSNVLTILDAGSADIGSYQLIISNAYGYTTSSNAQLILQSPALVGHWLTGAANYSDSSGYSPANLHDGILVGSGVLFTNDAPPGWTGQSLDFVDGATALIVTNSSTLDLAYSNTFDGPISSGLTVSCWAKGFPGGWNPFVSKWGEGEGGWQLRNDGDSGGDDTFACWTVRNSSVGNVTLGAAVYGNSDDMATRTIGGNDGNWHLYTGTFDDSSGIRNLYIDGVLAASEDNNFAPDVLASSEHLCIGAKDSPPGATYGNYFIGEIYDVRVYNYAISYSQVLPLLGTIPPRILTQPLPIITYGGVAAEFQAQVVSPVAATYHWKFDSGNLVDGGAISGSQSNVLSIANVNATNAGTYQLIINNVNGTTVSSNVTLSIVSPVAGSYEQEVLSDSPLAFWKLNESSNAAIGGAEAYDYIGGAFNGVYDTNAENGFNGITGPQFPGFPANDSALGTQNGTIGSYVSASAGQLVASNLTYAMWINPNSTPPNYTGLLMDRGGAGEGFGYSGQTNSAGEPALGYTWNNNNGDTYDWNSKLIPPLNEWSFVALVISPAEATVYMVNADGFHSTNHVIAHDAETFGVNWHIGDDANGATGGQTFPGSIADVGVFLSSLSSNQIVRLYDIGVGVTPPPREVSVPLVITQSAGNVTLTWTQGSLLQSTSVAGPWTTDSSATSPYTVPTSGSQMFYKVGTP